MPSTFRAKNVYPQTREGPPLFTASSIAQLPAGTLFCSKAPKGSLGPQFSLGVSVSINQYAIRSSVQLFIGPSGKPAAIESCFKAPARLVPQYPGLLAPLSLRVLHR